MCKAIYLNETLAFLIGGVFIMCSGLAIFTYFQSPIGFPKNLSNMVFKNHESLTRGIDLYCQEKLKVLNITTSERFNRMFEYTSAS